MPTAADLDRYAAAVIQAEKAEERAREAESAAQAARRECDEAVRERDRLRQRLVTAEADEAQAPQDALSHETNGSAAAVSHRGRDTAPETLWAMSVLLEDAEDVSSDVLGEHLGITKDAAWQRLQRLIEIGYAERPRRGRYAITDEGRRVAQEAEN